jgi:DNA-binding transcriptional LysR family regulator
MRVFTSVVAKESFAQAAELLGVSRGYVSRHVSELETHLGVPLLLRNTRHVSLTPAGEQYYQHCCRILRDVDESEKSVVGLHQAVAGSLKVIAKRSFGSLELSSAIVDFSLRHPELAVSLILEDQGTSPHDLIDESFDVAIRLSPLPNSRLISRKIATIEFVTCASPEYLEAFGAPVHPRDLAAHNCLYHLHGALKSQSRLWDFIASEGCLSVEVKGKPNSNNIIVLGEFARRGLGIAILPLFCIKDDLASGRLVPILTAYHVESRDLLAVYPPNSNTPKRTTEFVDFLAERFGKSAKSEGQVWSATRRDRESAPTPELQRR